MRYHERRPRPPLGRFVECLWFAEGDGRGAPVETIVPDGCPEIIVHRGERFRRLSAGGSELQPHAFLVGEMTRPLRVQPTGRVATLGIRFRPAGLRAFLRVPLDELTDRATPLDALWGRAARDLEEAIGEARDDAECARRAEDFLLARLDDGPGIDRPVAAAVRLILGEGGQVRPAVLGRAVSLSERQLERRFRTAVGVGPKALARVVRFQAVLRRLGEDGRRDWREVALEGGYFDQSHLARDFRDLAGVSPTRYLAGEGELAPRFVEPARLAELFAPTS